MSKNIQIMAAPGKDYSTAQHAVNDLDAGRAFKILDFHHPKNGKPVTKSEIVGNYDTVTIVYNQHRRKKVIVL